MKIAILNGNPAASSFDIYLSQLGRMLTDSDHCVTQIDLRNEPLRYCIGCWSCWVKTPGECIVRDVSHEMGRAVINADFVLWAAPLKMGFPSALLKMALDKHLALIHPYMELDHGEAHHLQRYSRYPRLGLLVEKENTTDEQDLQIIADIHCRTALNLKSRLEFCLTTDTTLNEIAKRIMDPTGSPLPLPGQVKATSGVVASPPTRLTLFNGSPRGRRGNTPILLSEFANGFGAAHEMHHLIQVTHTDQFVQAFADAECVMLGFPLYTDSMPGSVKNFIEALEGLVGRKGNPPIGFLVQSGFPEGLHSRYVERYLQKLATRLGSPYLGTIVKGNGEPVRIMPPNMNRRLFQKLQSLGTGLAHTGQLDPKVLARLTYPERFPGVLVPLLQAVLQMPFAHSYFDGLLKTNGAYEQRFAQPFLNK